MNPMINMKSVNTFVGTAYFKERARLTDVKFYSMLVGYICLIYEIFSLLLYLYTESIFFFLCVVTFGLCGIVAFYKAFTSLKEIQSLYYRAPVHPQVKPMFREKRKVVRRKTRRTRIRRR